MQSSRRKKRRISPREHIRNYRRDRSMYRRMHWYADFPTIVLTAILAIFGVVMIFSASYYKSLNTDGSPFVYLRKQTIFVVGGFVLMYLFSYVDYRKWKKFTYLIGGVTFLALLLVKVPHVGTTVGGATRWIRLGPISLMPGEFAKAAAIFLAAAYLSADMSRGHTKKGVGGLAVIAILMAGPIMLQPNMSTAITVVGIIAGMAFLDGFSARILVGLAVLGTGGVMMLRFTGTYWGRRVTSFLDPFASAKGDGFQVVQSLLALGTGGLTGRGLGQSIQKNLYLPEPQNDFILAVIGEELGLIGVLILLLVFLLLIWRLCRIALLCDDNYGMLLAGGLAVMIGLQVVFNVGVVTSFMPPTGVALPFISYGGNSVLILLGMVGITLNISRQNAASQTGPEKPARSGAERFSHSIQSIRKKAFRV